MESLPARDAEIIRPKVDVVAASSRHTLNMARWATPRVDLDIVAPQTSLAVTSDRITFRDKEER